MLDCTTEDYDRIYEPWLGNAGALLDLAKYEPGDRLLDLCGGTGAVTHAAWVRGSEDSEISRLTLFDLNPRFQGMGALMGCSVYCVQGRAEDLLRYFPANSFDVVVCRQAIGYVEIKRVTMNVALLLAPGGRFAFNTFIYPLDGGVKRYCFKQYRHEGSRYIEAYFFDGTHVNHLQWRPGVGWDVTRFKYYSEADFQEALAPWFDVAIEREGRSLHYLCTRKELKST